MAKKNSYLISLRNCRNIVETETDSICIENNSLNVFYGKNGTGKTSLISALRYLAKNDNTPLSALESFDFKRTGDQSLAPEVKCSRQIKEILVFDEKWIADHCFKKSSIHENAFELYVRNDEIRKLEKQRNRKLSHLKAVLASPETESFKSSLDKLIKKIGRLRKDGGFRSNAPITTAFENGSPLEPIPGILRSTVKSMKPIEQAKWLTRHKAAPKINSEETCPYCGTKDSERTKTCRQYDANRSNEAVKQWESIASIYSDLEEELARTPKATLNRVIKSTSHPTAQQIEEIVNLVGIADKTRGALSSIDEAINDSKSLEQGVLAKKLNELSKVISSCPIFLKTKNGKETDAGRAISRILSVTRSISQSQSEIDEISRALIKNVRNTISNHKKEINDFLGQTGFPYQIVFDCNAATSEADILLTPNYSEEYQLTDAGESLSYGEKNALSLVLFMHEALRQPNSLVVLDDPISSFDYDKRYGILYALFSKNSSVFKNNLSKKTVLVTTHDLLVLTDLIGIHVAGIGTKTVKGKFLSCNRDGILTAVPLGEDSLTPYTQLLIKHIDSCRNKPRIFGYVKIRQLCELLRKSKKEQQTAYSWSFSLLSDIIHGRSTEEALKQHEWNQPDERKIKMCENLISKLTGWKVNLWEEIDFYSNCNDYLINIYENNDLSSEEKLLIVRLLIERNSRLADNSKTMARFADESCHPGGSYLYQLDGETFDQIPFYVIDWCDSIVDKAKQVCRGKA